MKWKYGGASAIGTQAIHLYKALLFGTRSTVTTYTGLLSTFVCYPEIGSELYGFVWACMEGGASDKS